MGADLVKLITLQKVEDDCVLCIGEEGKQIPFAVKRFYTITTPKPGEPRGSHAHHLTDQLIICLHGSARIILDDGQTRAEVFLNEPHQALLLPRMVWHEMHDLTEDTILLIVSSHPYEPGDYIRNYDQFLRHVHQNPVQ